MKYSGENQTDIRTVGMPSELKLPGDFFLLLLPPMLLIAMLLPLAGFIVAEDFLLRRLGCGLLVSASVYGSRERVRERERNTKIKT